jgi:hypothetical protein
MTELSPDAGGVVKRPCWQDRGMRFNRVPLRS